MTKKEDNNKGDSGLEKPDMGVANEKSYSLSVKEAWERGESLDSFLDRASEAHQEKLKEINRQKMLAKLMNEQYEQQAEHKRKIHKQKMIDTFSDMLGVVGDGGNSGSRQKKFTDPGAVSEPPSGSKANKKANNNSTTNGVGGTMFNPRIPTAYPQDASSAAYHKSYRAKFYGDDGYGNVWPNKQIYSPPYIGDNEYDQKKKNVNIDVNLDFGKSESDRIYDSELIKMKLIDQHYQAQEAKRTAEAYKRIEEGLIQKAYEKQVKFYKALNPGDLFKVIRPTGKHPLRVPINEKGEGPELGLNYNFNQGFEAYDYMREKQKEYDTVEVTIVPKLDPGFNLMFLGFIAPEDAEETLLPCVPWKLRSTSLSSLLNNKNKPEKEGQIKLRLHGAKWLYNGKTFISTKYPEIRNLKALTGTMPEPDRSRASEVEEKIAVSTKEKIMELLKADKAKLDAKERAVRNEHYQALGYKSMNSLLKALEDTKEKSSMYALGIEKKKDKKK